MKVIKISNFDLETVSDTVIAEGIIQYYAESIAELLNKEFGGDDSPDYFKAVENNYKLYQFNH